MITLFAEDFIQRFGTHYIKAGRFGGQLEIRKSMDEVQNRFVWTIRPSKILISRGHLHIHPLEFLYIKTGIKNKTNNALPKF